MPGFERRSIGLAAAGLVGAGLVLWVKSGAPTDFAQDYFAARALLEGHSIYGEEVAELGRQRFGVESPLNFHPPPVTVAFLPISFLPYRLAFVLFGLSTVAVFAVLFWLTLSLPPEPLPPLLYGAAAVIAVSTASYVLATLSQSTRHPESDVRREET